MAIEREEDRVFVEPIPLQVDQESELPGAPSQAKPPEQQPAGPRRLRMGLFQRVSLHLILLILISGFILTAVTAAHFRRVMYQEEFRSAFTVFTAAANYLGAHFRSHKGKLVPEHLDYVFSQHFMRLRDVPAEQKDRITHRPAHLAVYDAARQLLYEYSDAELTAERPRTNVPPPENFEYAERYDPDGGAILVSGPIIPDKEAVGILHVTFPSNIKERLALLYRQMALVLLLVALASIGTSLLFARRELAPIHRLSAAARRVHAGELDQQIPVRTDDEIGDLTRTFNEMLGAISRRITLLHRMQDSLMRMGGVLDSGRLHQSLELLFLNLSSARTCRLYTSDADHKTLLPGTDREGGSLPDLIEDDLTQRAFQDRWSHFLDLEERVTSEKVRCLEMAIPLLSGKRRLGVIRIGRREPAGSYDDETTTILHTLAQYASMAMENAGLYAQLAERERIEQEMRWARSIQQALLPQHDPVVTGFEIVGSSLPASEVGGDYFDYIRCADARWHVVIGDVSGKGVPAALIMSTVRSLIHTYLEFKSSPRDVLTLVNRSLSGNLERDMFVTLSSLRLDPDRNRAAIARAGHEPLIILRATGDIEYILPRGPALGLLEVDQFHGILEETEFDLGPHDTLVLYTDGITEAQNAKRMEFGQERLEHILADNAGLPTAALHEKILHEVSQYARGMPQRDDITLIVIRRNGSAA